MFCHSLASCWSHGNVHFLRGIASELVARGHEVSVLEPRDAWSVENLVADHGAGALDRWREVYPELESSRYDPDALDVGAALDGADLVLVHERSDPSLVARVGEHRAHGGRYALLFHDTHHRAVTAPAELARYDLSGYDGVLAFGRVIRDLYLERGWARRAWTWHEAADVRVFRPLEAVEPEGDLVWIGNGCDEEMTAELREFLIEPTRALGLATRVHGVRYAESVLEELARAGIEFGGWVPNHEVPRVLASFRATIHVPRRSIVDALPGVPTIRVFEALACGAPLVSAPWQDSDGLFEPGRDFLVARNGAEMATHLARVIEDRAFARELAERGRRTVLARHTCAHRVDELLAIHSEIGEA
jgi:spore maturation protein CgeB